MAQFLNCNLSEEEARALIVVREAGEINNFTYRFINCVDTLTASQHLGRLRDHGLLEHKGKGSATYYTLIPNILDNDLSGELAAKDSYNLEGNSTDNNLSSELISKNSPNLESSSTDNNSVEILEYLRQVVEKNRASKKNKLI